MILSNLTDRGTLRGKLSRGSNGSTVSITPLYNTGIDICIYTIDGVEGHIFVPDMSTDIEINPVSFQDPKTKIADYRIGNTNGAIYIPKDEVIGYASGAIASFSDGAEEPIKSIDILISAASSESYIIRTNQNICGGISFANTIIDEVPSATINYVDQTVKYTGANIHQITLFDKFKPNTQYTIYNKVKTGAAVNMVIEYTDNTTDVIIPNTIKKSNISKSIYRLRGFYATGTTELYYNDFGIIEGDKSIDDFVICISDKYIISFPTTINDGYIHIEYNGSWAGYINDNQTSTTYTIQPEDIPHIITLLGYNNVWSNTGDIGDLKYIVSNRIFLQYIHDNI